MNTNRTPAPLLAGCQAGPGLRAMQCRIGIRQSMGCTRAADMTACDRTVGIGKAGRKTARGIRMKTGGVRLDIMANGTGNIG